MILKIAANKGKDEDIRTSFGYKPITVKNIDQKVPTATFQKTEQTLLHGRFQGPSVAAVYHTGVVSGG